jgi:hypothetical protein
MSLRSSEQGHQFCRGGASIARPLMPGSSPGASPVIRPMILID